MSKRSRLTCNDCYFRQMALCALKVDAPCPTFRLYERGALVTSRQAPLIPRAVEPAEAAAFLPQHQAA